MYRLEIITCHTQSIIEQLLKVAGHPLAQNEKSLHIFLQEATIDRNYTPGKVRAT